MTRVIGYVVGLVAVFAAALGVGRLVDPIDVEPAADEHAHGGTGHEAGHAERLPGGLQVSESGYTLDSPGSATSGRDVHFAFRIVGTSGHPVLSYDVQHEKQLHLIVVRRDLTGFQHVHPTLDDDGTWHTTLDLTPGTWRVFADVKPTGADPITLGKDLLVPGAVRAVTEQPDTRVSEVDGLTVTLAGDLSAGAESLLTLTVAGAGQPVEVEPYLGASGHLVALREGDLAYLHVHPESTASPDDLAFATTVPSNGRYHLFLDFKVGGVVRTASFVLTVGGSHDHD